MNKREHTSKRPHRAWQTRPWLPSVLLLAFTLTACQPDIGPQQFKCDPKQSNNCPEGWLCLPQGADHYCVDRVGGFCGDDKIDPGEECDGLEFGGYDCADFGEPDGVISCTSRCYVSCLLCGNGTVDLGEECDDGLQNSDVEPDACRLDCQSPYNGDGTCDQSESPLSLDCGGVRALAAGYRHTCVIAAEGTTWCWGDGGSYQLGQGTTNSSLTPVLADTTQHARALSAGDADNCIVTSGSELWCWGTQISSFGASPGHLGNIWEFEEVADATAVVVGPEHSCAIPATGLVWCWGRTDYGQIGVVPDEWPDWPNPVYGPSNAIAVAVGAFHTCAVTVDGAVWCWGRNEKGQLGRAATPFSNVPTKLEELSDVVAIAAGADHTCAVTSDHTTWCWGDNSSGQLGRDEAHPSSAPKQVQHLGPVVAVTAGAAHTCAAGANGTAWCWGDGALGQLGDATNENSALTPVAVSGLTHVVAISARYNHTCAVTSWGRVWCWGDNSAGQLGDQTLTSANQPVLANF